MSSVALNSWLGARGRSLDNLVAAHARITNGRRGRQWFTEEINHALITRLASEFQGYCRDLHDEAVEVVVVRVADLPIQSILRASLMSDRKLDKGNANWSNVCQDFQRLGFSLKDDLSRWCGDPIYRRHTTALDQLNTTRNALAHQDAPKIRECHESYRLTLTTFKKWRRELDRTAHDLDAVLEAYLTQLTGDQPW